MFGVNSANEIKSTHSHTCTPTHRQKYTETARTQHYRQAACSAVKERWACARPEEGIYLIYEWSRARRMCCLRFARLHVGVCAFSFVVVVVVAAAA